MKFVTPDLQVDLGRGADLGLEDGPWPDVTLGVRAEDVIVQPGGAVSGIASFPATVGLMEPIGSDTFVELDVGSAMIVARVEPEIPALFHRHALRHRGTAFSRYVPGVAGRGRARAAFQRRTHLPPHTT